MYLKTLGKTVPNHILVTQTNDPLLYIEPNTHFVFSYQGTDYITIESVNGDVEKCIAWEPYNEKYINDIFFSGEIEYIECSLEKFNKIKLFL